jgi:ferredoxin-NADP reductase
MTDSGPAPTPGPWQTARIVEIRPETATAKTFRLALPRPSPHLAGQHYIVRLTAPDGYRASRSYSVASAPDGTPELELTIERLEDGEVSTFLHDVAAPGDDIEVRGPIGGWFVWRGDRPALLVGGGIGVVPLMAMLRLARRQGRPDLVRLVVSVSRPGDLCYPAELPGPETTIVYTRQVPASWPRPAGRLTPADFAAATGANHSGGDSGSGAGPAGSDVTGYVCGSAGFADAASELLVGLGLPAAQIRVERFGPSG